MTTEALTLFDLADTSGTETGDRLPASIDLMTAASLLGIGRTCAYALVRKGQWPTPVIRVGRCIRIPTRPMLALLDPDRAVIHSLAAVDDRTRPPR